VLDALRRGPRTTFEIARIVCGDEPPERDAPPTLTAAPPSVPADAAVEPAAPAKFTAESEGFLFATLLELRQRGLVTADWIDVGSARRKLYRLADDPAEAVGVRASAVPPGDDFRHVADQMTKSLAFAPRVRDETRAEILHHLADAAASLAPDSESPEEAKHEAVRRIGDPWKCNVDLGRAAQGKRTALFPTKISEYLAALTIYDLRVLLVILAVIAFVRVQVITAYHIPTKSMEPTLHGDPKSGDRILVDKLAGPPGRFDITVFDGWGEDRKNYVKRCVGLPGERIELREGDLYADDQLVRKDGDAYEGLLFEVFDAARERKRAAGPATDPKVVETAFRKRMQDLWRFEGDGECGLQEDESATFAGFRIAARAQGPDVVVPRLAWHEAVEDSYVDPESGETRSGVYSVADMRLTASVKPVPGTDAHVSLVLTRGSDQRFAAVVHGDGEGVSLVAGDSEVARAPDVKLREGVPTTVSFSFVDHVLRLSVAGVEVLRHELPAPEYPRKSGPAGEPLILVKRGAAWIDPVRLERDVYYVADGPDENFIRLRHDQYFMMGDNSSNSSDSRQHGPVHESRLVGSPLLIVWPPSRMRVPK
jgi:signal peptidase I